MKEEQEKRYEEIRDELEQNSKFLKKDKRNGGFLYLDEETGEWKPVPKFSPDGVPIP